MKNYYLSDTWTSIYLSKLLRQPTSSQTNRGKIGMNSKMNMIYWKSDKFWLGKLLEHPEIITQGETLEKLEVNLKEA